MVNSINNGRIYLKLVKYIYLVYFVINPCRLLNYVELLRILQNRFHQVRI